MRHVVTVKPFIELPYKKGEGAKKKVKVSSTIIFCRTFGWTPLLEMDNDIFIFINYPMQFTNHHFLFEIEVVAKLCYTTPLGLNSTCSNTLMPPLELQTSAT